VTGPLEPGERVLLIDAKQRQYLLTLKPGGEFHSHAGPVAHDDLLGQDEGRIVASARGMKFSVYRPTLSDFVYKMPRGAQVIYPKDLATILMLADIAPGVRVFESGLGSGALSMAMLRAGAVITGYELRADFLARARENVESFLGDEALGRYLTEERSSYDGIDGTDFDRIVLDLPEPWQVVPHAPGALRSGGILLAYTPSVTQVMQVTEALIEQGFDQIQTLEVLHRTWHVEGQAVRPDHRMVAHTGFLTHGRLRTS